MHTGRTPCQDESRDEGMQPREGRSKIVSKPTGARREAPGLTSLGQRQPKAGEQSWGPTGGSRPSLGI